MLFLPRILWTTEEMTPVTHASFVKRVKPASKLSSNLHKQNTDDVFIHVSNAVVNFRVPRQLTFISRWY